VAVARLHPQKRLDVLVDAAAGWAGEPDAPLVVVAGEGPARAALARQVAGTGAPVRLLGHRDDVAELLAAADVVVLSSDWEARSLVAQEALRAGRPLVATAVGGLPGLVGDAALLVPPGDPAALAGAVRRVLAEPALAAELGRRGRDRAATWPDGEAAVDLVAAAYTELLAGRA
jgi:glycosyltransferase involved in cell wall biosynthesis